jgi:TonB family protein
MTPPGPEGGTVEGEVVLRVTVDQDGRVTNVQVLKPLDPEVDRAAAQALGQWTFEAAPPKDKSRPVSFAVSFHFRKGAAWNLGSGEDLIPPPIEAVAPAAGDLERILASSAEYCRKLSAAVLDFVCEERIVEEIYNYVFDPTPTYTQITMKRRMDKFTYLYDYQMIRTEAGVREDRTLLEENGRKTKEAHAALKTKKFFSYQSIYGPIGFFGRDRQSLFAYKLAGKNAVNGKKTWVIEIKPKSDGEKLPSGKAWVDQDTSQILKLEIDAQSLEGFAQALKNYDLDKVTPEFRTEHYYEVEKKGLLFPSQTTFRENVRIQKGRRVQIAKTEILFTNYRFFTIQTEAAIKDQEPRP